MKNSLLIVGFALILGHAGDAATIVGSVRGSDGSTITAGLVSASREPGRIVSRLARTSAGTAILPDGTFRLPSLPDGVYRICAQAPGTAWLNPCEWGQNGNIVSLSSKQPLLNVPIVLTKGALVTVRVNDPSQVLDAHEGKTPGAHLLIGVGNDSHFFRTATITSKAGASRTYQILVPFDRSINISVASGLFQLRDESTMALPQFGNLIPVRWHRANPPGRWF